MKVEVTEKFYKDVARITNSQIKLRLTRLIEFIEKANRLDDLPAIKKLRGYKNAYRLRLGLAAFSAARISINISLRCLQTYHFAYFNRP